jgi:hypothetical protein
MAKWALFMLPFNLESERNLARNAKNRRAFLLEL